MNKNSTLPPKWSETNVDIRITFSDGFVKDVRFNDEERLIDYLIYSINLNDNDIKIERI